MFRSLRFRALLRLLRGHRIVTLSLVVLLVAWCWFSVIVGFAPMIVLVVPVALLAWLILDRVAARGGLSGFAEAGSIAGAVVASSVLVFGAIQLVPYGRDRTNPPVTGEPQWANPETRELMVRACFGCHSNEVEYPSYASVAPISWMVQWHIDEGRESVNYSEWDVSTHGGDETWEEIKKGSMPPPYYTRFGRHPEANLTDAELETLLAGVRATPGLYESDGYGRGDKDDD